MTDDELEDLLREVALEGRVAVDPRWEAFTRGELGQADVDALVASDPATAELFRPLDVDEVLQALAPPAGSSLASDDDLTPTLEAARSPANRLWAGFVAFAVLAAVALFVLRPSNPPLPPYTLEVSGGVQVLRGPQGADPPRLAPGSPVLLRLRPATRVEGPVPVAVYAGDLRLEGIEVEISDAGAVRIRVIDAPPGTRALRVEIGEGAQVQRWIAPILVDPPG